MFRYVLTAYMLLLSLTGPNLCCCVVARLAETTLSSVKTGEHHEMRRLACCQGEFAGRFDESPDESKSVPHSPRERCKCVQRDCDSIRSRAVEFTVETNRSWVNDLILSLACPQMLETRTFSAIVVHPDGTPPATLSGREIRVALHSWQC